MKFRFMALAVAALAMTFSPALAANNYDVIDAHGATRTMAAKDVAGVLHGQHVIEGLSSGTVTPANMTVPGVIDVNCLVGCSALSAVTIADGASLALGATTAPTWAGSGDGTQISIAKYTAAKVEATRALLAGTLTVSGTVTIGGTLPAFAATPTFNCGTGCSGSGVAQGSATAGQTGGLVQAAALTAAPTYTTATTNPITTDIHGALRTLNVDSTGAPLDPTQGLNASTNTIGGVNLRSAATGGCTVSGQITTASTNALNIKNAAGTFCGGMAINTTASLVFLRLYNLSGTPTCSSATGYVTTIPVPASTTGSGTKLELGPFGGDFPTGIGACVTGGGANNDNTNAVSGVYMTYAVK